MCRTCARALSAAAVLVALLVGSGCEQRRFDAAVARDTQDAYLGFLARYESGFHAAEARLRIEALRWQAARGSDSIYAVRRFLADYPDGRFTDDARRRLAELRLARARAAADAPALRRFLETRPAAPLAREAREVLQRLALKAALSSGDLGALRAFVDEFADGPGVEEARRVLRGRELQLAGDDAPALERLRLQHPGTPEAVAATRRLAVIEARGVRAAGAGAPAALERLRVRYPDHPELRALQALADGIALRCASVWLDAGALQQWLQSHPTHAAAGAARTTLKALRRRPAVARRGRTLLDAALPYRPALPLDALRRRALGGELEAARIAVAELAHAPEREAVGLLVDLATGPQLVVAAQAVTTLQARCRARGVACADLLARAPAARPGEPAGLRRAVLRLAVGDERGALDALANSTVAGQQPGRGRILPTLLLAQLRLRLGPADPARAAVERAVAAVEAHLAALERLFPVEIDRERTPEALLAARTAAALARLLAPLATPAAAPLRARLDARVREWEGRLAAVVPGFVPSADDPLAAALRAHEQRQAAAVAALESLARKEALLRPALEGVRAARADLRVCPSARSVTGVGPGSRPVP